MQHWLVTMLCKTGGPDPEAVFRQRRRFVVAGNSAEVALGTAGLHLAHQCSLPISVEHSMAEPVALPFELDQGDD